MIQVGGSRVVGVNQGKHGNPDKGQAGDGDEKHHYERRDAICEIIEILGGVGMDKCNYPPFTATA